MNRRGFLGLLGSLPFLGFLKPKNSKKILDGEGPVPVKSRHDPTPIGEISCSYTGSYYNDNIHTEILYEGPVEGFDICKVPEGERWHIDRVEWNMENSYVVVYGHN